MMRYHNNRRRPNTGEGGQQRPQREYRSNNRNEREERGHQNNHHAILPPAHVLQEYEYIAEGSVAKLLALAERELEHRHRFENKSRASEVLSYRLGQIAGLVMILFLIGAAVQLAEGGQEILAGVIATSGFFSLIFAALLNSNRNRGSRKKFSNNRRNHDHRNRGREEQRDRSDRDRRDGNRGDDRRERDDRR